MIAGIVSTLLFAGSNIPMLLKAYKTRDLSSYSPAYLVLSNIGNLIHWLYIISLPFGPIWLLHGFFSLSCGLMLFWYIRYESFHFKREFTRAINKAVLRVTSRLQRAFRPMAASCHRLCCCRFLCQCAAAVAC